MIIVLEGKGKERIVESGVVMGLHTTMGISALYNAAMTESSIGGYEVVVTWSVDCVEERARISVISKGTGNCLK